MTKLERALILIVIILIIVIILMWVEGLGIFGVIPGWPHPGVT